eukprot:COSAG02_NODE_3846_length_6153_cov_1.953089_7_plen_109_part_00
MSVYVQPGGAVHIAELGTMSTLLTAVIMASGAQLECAYARLDGAVPRAMSQIQICCLAAQAVVPLVGHFAQHVTGAMPATTEAAAEAAPRCRATTRVEDMHWSNDVLQ